MSEEKYYPEVDSNPNFSKIEESILKFWKKDHSFQKSIDNRPTENEFVFYDGPPFANGLPHYGHLLTGFVKDTVARFQTMRGKRVERRFGWDCHGLPAELSAQKELGISGRHEIVDYGVDKFNEHCRLDVMKYSQEWEYYVKRQARWVDFENDYKTMDKSYMESVLWAFKQLYDKGLVYQSMRVMPYSWACETPLSNFETRLDNSYREVADKAITVTFKLKDIPEFLPANLKSYKLMAWTTTPWTLPSNLALGVSNNVEYSCVVKDGECLILATQSLTRYAKELGEDASSIVNFSGDKLVDLTYEPILPYFKDNPNSFKILHGDFVTAEDGTGIVHLAPAFGEDDQLLCEANNIKMVCPVNDQGRFTSQVPDYQDMLVFDANDEIIKRLKKDGSWIKTEQYIHNYPHCWRTDTPLIYKAVPSWYIKVTAFKDRMVELNQQINWIPGHVKNGLFGKWLENARDWSISRNRFWGTPIPIWMSDDPNYPRIDVYGSIEELEKDFGIKVEDLHKPFIDQLTRSNPNDPTGNSKMVRVPDVFDCWFDSGSMPYGQVHYPFENKEKFEKHFPADFIVEYTAQTRGWFYTLMVLSTALFDRPPFLNCICHGVILDENGQKLSKRLQNYADPKELFSTYGSDALRFLMLSSPVLRGQELLIDKDGAMVKDVLRLSIKPIWNAYNFLTLYANSDGIKAEYSYKCENIIDKYILSKTKTAVSNIKLYMDEYNLASACEEVNKFFEVLNNWYIRRSRARFWKKEKDQDKQEAYNTLFTALNLICRAAAPLLPLITEEIYRGLNGGESVHLTDFPDVSDIEECVDLVNAMDKVREVCSTALSIRNNENIRIRQPLVKLSLLGNGLEALEQFKEIIQDEVNVKEVETSSQIGDKAQYKLKINFPVLGKRLPTKIKEIIPASKQGKWEKLSDGRIKVANEVLEPQECELLLEVKDTKGSQPLSSNDAIVILDLNISEDLANEGIVRDLVRAIQQSRRDADLHISSQIELKIETSEIIKDRIQPFINYINEQTLSNTAFNNTLNCKFTQELELDNEKVKIGFSVIGS